MKSLFSILLAVTIISLVLVLIVALLYSYSTLSIIESGAGLTLLIAVAGFLWLYPRRIGPRHDSPETHRAILAGMVLGLLWIIEININNFAAPPLPARDIIDNIFWAIIALSILFLAVFQAYRTASIIRGVKIGLWSGIISGLLACAMALLIIVFGMHFITRDPLNVTEWAEYGATSDAPSMAAYFAFETLAGAFGHLIILGIIMGGLLGIIGGFLGKSLQWASRRLGRARQIQGVK
jgi:hypothetical protein